ncbi:unnamed protein product [Phytophthora fragariaefolia]|uniref:Unnamed protein product n=1 Tax=Phytophthora fragariaefolia TaxID=1490495 RepID=A0A9W6U540_9STRA|nr:unnamed protein product [Phytophthora fragariaefolia]
MEDDEEIARIVDSFLKDMDELERHQEFGSSEVKDSAARSIQVSATEMPGEAPAERIPTLKKRKRELDTLRQHNEEMKTRVLFLRQEKRCREIGVTLDQLYKLRKGKLEADRKNQWLQAAKRENQTLWPQLQECSQISSAFQTTLGTQKKYITNGVAYTRSLGIAADISVLQPLSISSFSVIKTL